MKGQVTVPKPVREALRLSPGDALEFQVNGNGEVVLRKAPSATPTGGRRGGHVHPRVEAQMRRRAAELLALLRGLD
ncbi:MAG TPA: AbrB/MazE/SpoVT family DNA-binding domain-containing protein [Steroidobacteraceae bacterium]|nr:AbrB/MazE/SpoVT family DNA-binding domain-containing protein [Steroidobacteraceae bacterium]